MDERGMPTSTILHLTYIVFQDWKVFVSMLLQIGYWDIHDKHAAQEFFPIATSQLTFLLDDETESRIWDLTVTGIRSLPKGIHRLDRLERLNIHIWQNNNISPPARAKFHTQAENVGLSSGFESAFGQPLRSCRDGKADSCEVPSD
jgi:hypothetical protein